MEDIAVAVLHSYFQAMNHLDLNISDGTLRCSGSVIAGPDLSVRDVANQWPPDALRDDLSVGIYRLVPDAKWLEYSVEVIAIKFALQKCQRVSIQLFGVSAGYGKRVESFEIAVYLAEALKCRIEKIGKVTAELSPPSGRVICTFDYKLDAPTAQIVYKKSRTDCRDRRTKNMLG